VNDLEFKEIVVGYVLKSNPSHNHIAHVPECPGEHPKETAFRELGHVHPDSELVRKMVCLKGGKVPEVQDRLIAFTPKTKK
jgi:hypothetical protein